VLNFVAKAQGFRGGRRRLQHRGTVYDLEASELCYAPQYGSAKDPVNLAGMVAVNFLRGDVPTVYREDLPGAEVSLLDVRTAEEYASGHVPGAVNIPIDELRPRLDELPKDREIWSYCYVGQCSYIGVRMMVQHGFDAKNITGGFRMYTMMD
jgi:rhodanese-related sulfurtransferase